MKDLLFPELRSAARRAWSLFLWIAGGLVLLYFLSGIYSVRNDEVGVLRCFGRIVNPRVLPGIHYALPPPFYRVDRVPVRKVERLTVDDFSHEAESGPNPFTLVTGLNTYAVTGDNNLVNLACVVQYKVKDPVAYLFNLRSNAAKVRSPSAPGLPGVTEKLFLHEMACNTLLHCIARMAVDQALTDRDSIVTCVKQGLQERLDAIQSGLSVLFVEIRGLKPPAPVQQYFADVIKAKNDKVKAVRDAESYRNEEIPAAQGRAARLLAGGEAYHARVVERAKGDAERFLKRLEEYRKNRILTRYRLYMETLQEILPALGSYHVVDTRHGKAVRIRLVR